jgi:hypothetical protein
MHFKVARKLFFKKNKTYEKLVFDRNVASSDDDMKLYISLIVRELILGVIFSADDERIEEKQKQKQKQIPL